MPCNCNNTVSPDGEELPLVSDDLGASPGISREVCCEDPILVPSDPGSGTTLETKWLDAECYTEGVTLLGRVGNKLAKLSGSGFVKVTGGLLSVVTSVPLSIRTLWHRWWKANATANPVLGAPLDYPYNAIADSSGNLHLIRGEDGKDTVAVWDGTEKVYKQVPYSTLPHAVASSHEGLSAIELVGYAPRTVKCSTIERAEKYLAAEGLVILEKRALTGDSCGCGENDTDTYVAKAIALAPPTGIYLLKTKEGVVLWEEGGSELEDLIESRCVRHDTTQTLDATHRHTARKNIRAWSNRHVLTLALLDSSDMLAVSPPNIVYAFDYTHGGVIKRVAILAATCDINGNDGFCGSLVADTDSGITKSFGATVAYNSGTWTLTCEDGFNATAPGNDCSVLSDLVWSDNVVVSRAAVPVGLEAFDSDGMPYVFQGTAWVRHAHDWDELIGTADVVPFNVGNGGPTEVGELGWDSTEETLSLVLNHGVVLQIGEESVIHVENTTGQNIADGTPVMFAGTVGNSGRIRVKPWDGTTPRLFLGLATCLIETSGH